MNIRNKNALLTGRGFFYAQVVPTQLVIFDIAGTIIQDRGEVSQAFVDALRKHGFAIADSDLLEWKGAGKRAVIRHLLTQSGRVADESMVEQIHTAFVATLHGLYEAGALQATDGAEETFKALRDRGLTLAVTTGFGRSTMEMLLARLGWAHYFAAAVSTEDVPHGRPAPDMILQSMRRTGVSNPFAVANVGDTPLDLQSAAAAGVALNIGVLSGMHTRERLEQELHTHLLTNVGELVSLFEVCKGQKNVDETRG